MTTLPNSSNLRQPIVESLLPAHSVHLLAGAPGAGKTALAAWLFRQIADEQPVFGFPSHRPTALAVIAADRGWPSHRIWFEAVGLGGIPHYSFHDDGGFRWERLKGEDGWMSTLKAALEGEFCPRKKVDWLPPGSLVLVDPLSAFLGGDVLNYNRIFRALGELGQLCIRRAITILGTAHAGKQRAGKELQYARPQDRILGSSALIGCSDTVFYLATPTETGEPYSELHWIPHHAAPGCVRLERQPDTGLFQLSYRRSKAEIAAVDRATRETEATEKLAAKLALLLTLFTQPEGVAVIVLVERAGALGFSPRSVYRHLRRLAEEGRIVAVGRGVWKRVIGS